MKIAVVSRSINGKSGMGRIIANQVRFLAKKLQDGKVTVIANSIKSENFADEPRVVVRRPLFWFFNDKNSRGRFKKFAAELIAREKYDLVITHNEWYGDIAFIHNYYVMDRIKKPQKYADTIVVPSQMVKDEIIICEKICADRINVLPPGIDVGLFNKVIKEQQEELKRKYGAVDTKHPTPFVIALIASGSLWHRGLEQFVDVIKLLAEHIEDIFVVITGNAKWYDKLKIKRKMMRALGGRGRFRYFSSVAQIQEVYALTDLMIFPSVYDTFGMVVAESLACDTPVITNRNVGACSLLLPRAEEFIADSNEDIEKMKDLALMIYKNHKNCRQTFSEISDTIASNYSWEKHLREFEDIINSRYSLSR